MRAGPAPRWAPTAIAGAVVLLVTAPPGPARASESARLDSVVARFLPDRFAGAVRVERGGRVLLDRGYGLADRLRGVPNTPATIFPIGSLTKQLTAAAVMLLAGDGRLRTSDPVTRWLPETHPAWDGVTIRHLLSHTGGFQDALDPAEIADSLGTLSPGAWVVRHEGRQPPRFPPGTHYAYSNAGYLVLGRIIELASGMPYADFVTMRIVRPLGLHDTSFGTPLDSTRSARGCLARRGDRRDVPSRDFSAHDAAGGWWSTTRDLLRWQQALLGGRVLPPAALAEMTTPVQGDYAYGIHHRTSGGRETFYHTGRIPGFESALGDYVGDSIAIVVLENLDTGAVADVFNQLVLAARPASD